MLSNNSKQLNEMGMGDASLTLWMEMPSVREDPVYPPLVTLNIPNRWYNGYDER